MAIKASITLTSEAAELARLEAFAAAFARERGLPEGERARLLLILEELFTNVVAYGYGPGSPSGSVTVALQLRDGRLTIDFADDGRPFDPLAHAAPELPTAGKDPPIGGLGILVVRSLVDEARYRRRGGRNRLQLARQVTPARGREPPS
ncbi:MAG TPA: ATP-binding protein [Stellaceae bacterium]|nr:ATP-binding protein [Stellaceae bacterium]